MERGVPDTSVVVSAFLFADTTPAIALRHLIRHGTALASEETLAQLREVLLREKFVKRLPPPLRELLLSKFESEVELTGVTEIIDVCRDPKDNKFLSLAISGTADVILSGDIHLLELHPFRGIDILKPTAYLSR